MRPENAEEARDIADYKEQKAREREEEYKRRLVGKESPLTFEVQIRKMVNEISAMKIAPDDNQATWEEGYNQAIRNVVSKLEEWENAK